MKPVLNKMREERLKRKMTLEQLAQKTELSKGFLSQIERGLAQPSVSSLKKIAYQLGISVVKLYADGENNGGLWEYNAPKDSKKEETNDYINDVRVVRSTRRKGLTLPGSNVLYELLTPDLKRRLEVMYMRISEGEGSGEEPIVDPSGEKFGLVLKGMLEVGVGGDVHQLEPGDSIYFPAHFPHSWKGIAGDTIEVIWVLTPPCF